MFRLNQKGGLDPLVIIFLVIVVGLGGYVAWTIFEQSDNEPTVVEGSEDNNSPDSEINQDESQEADKDKITITDWNVEFPITKSGELYTNLTSDVFGSTPVNSNGGPADMTFVYLNIYGFGDNLKKTCDEGDGEITLGTTLIYRHKEKNPEINYTTTYTYEANHYRKIDDWFFSTAGFSNNSSRAEDLAETCLKDNDNKQALANDIKNIFSTFPDDFAKLEKIR